MLYQQKRLIKKYSPIILVAIFGLLFSGFAFKVLYQREVDEHIRVADLRAGTIVARIETELNSTLEILDALEAFYKSSNYVDREEFEEFSLIILKNEPAAKALQWLPKISNTIKQSFIEEARLLNLKDYSFKKLDRFGNWSTDYSSDVYFPVYYTIPRVLTRDLLGFDWNAVAERKIFIESLHDAEKHWALFDNIDSISKSNHSYSAVKALYDKSARNYTHIEVKQHLLGLFVVLVSFDDLIHDVISDLNLKNTEIHLYIKNGTNYEEVASTESKTVNPKPSKSSHKHFLKEYCQIADANFMLLVAPDLTNNQSINIYPALVLCISILALTIMLCVYLWQSMKREENIQAAVEERTIELKKSNEELDKFAYIASHDLKEPIRGIHAYANFLKLDHTKDLDADANEMLDTIKDLCERLTELINSLLEFSRLGRVDFAYKDTDLALVLENILISLKPYLEENNVEVIIQDRLPVIFCDSVRVGEVFRNLITNAVKYNKTEHKQIIIGCNSSPELGKVYYVRDNGIGIDPKHFDDVFQIFRKLNPASQFAEGTGVGLTLVKRIIERHNGRIWIESEKGKGSTFFFTLNASG